MPRTRKPEAQRVPPVPLANGPTGDVLTLDEAAVYLRLPAAEVVRLVHQQGLPARPVGAEWRFFRGAIQAWLSAPPPRGPKPSGIWAAAGTLKDDPYLDDMLEEIRRMRGGPATGEE